MLIRPNDTELTLQAEKLIFEAYEKCQSYSEVARKFGLNPGIVWRIINNQQMVNNKIINIMGRGGHLWGWPSRLRFPCDIPAGIGPILTGRTYVLRRKL